MTDKVKLEKLKKLADAMYYAAFNLTTDSSLLRKAMKEYRQFIIHEYCKKEPVSIWHDAIRKSDNPENVVIINPSDNTGEVLTKCTGVNQGHIWAYTSELLNLDNSCNIGKNLQEPQVKESTKTQHVNETCKENGDSLTQEPVSEDLGEYINELSKQFPEVSFAKLSRIAVRVAKWQKERFEKNRLAHCDALTEEQAQIESDFVTKHLKENSRTPTFIDSIEYGIKMQEEQMMAKAIDGEVTYGKSLAIPSLGWVLDKEGLDYGDKVKLIIIKED